MSNFTYGDELQNLNAGEKLPLMTESFIRAIQETVDAINAANQAGKYVAAEFADGSEYRIGHVFKREGENISCFNALSTASDTRRNQRSRTISLLDVKKMFITNRPF